MPEVKEPTKKATQAETTEPVNTPAASDSNKRARAMVKSDNMLPSPPESRFEQERVDPQEAWRTWSESNLVDVSGIPFLKYRNEPPSPEVLAWVKRLTGVEFLAVVKAE